MFISYLSRSSKLPHTLHRKANLNSHVAWEWGVWEWPSCWSHEAAARVWAEALVIGCGGTLSELLWGTLAVHFVLTRRPLTRAAYNRTSISAMCQRVTKTETSILHKFISNWGSITHAGCWPHLLWVWYLRREGYYYISGTISASCDGCQPQCKRYNFMIVT